MRQDGCYNLPERSRLYSGTWPKAPGLRGETHPNPTLGDIKNLLTFIEENLHTLRGVLIHAGKSIRWLHSKVLAVPWTWVGK
jgi:hypothetical protein